jgi:lipid-A-disaccharide synthase
VAILPGSRLFEVRRLAPVLLDAARILHERDESVRFLLPVADPGFAPQIEAEVARRGLEGAVVTAASSHEALRAADLALLASGTASLEAALIGTPMVIAYRLAALTMGIVRGAIALRLIDSDTVGLPNLVLGRRAIPEHIQRRACGAELAAEATRLLGNDALREEQRQALADVSRLLHAGGSDARAAEAVLAAAERRTARVPVFGGAVAREEGSGP